MNLVLTNGFCELTEEEALFIDGGFWSSLVSSILTITLVYSSSNTVDSNNTTGESTTGNSIYGAVGACPFEKAKMQWFEQYTSFFL